MSLERIVRTEAKVLTRERFVKKRSPTICQGPDSGARAFVYKSFKFVVLGRPVLGSLVGTQMVGFYGRPRI